MNKNKLMEDRLIVLKDGFVFIDVTDIAGTLWGTESLYAVDVENETETLIEDKFELDYWLRKRTLRICMEGGHLPKNKQWWDDSDKITHEGYVYVRTKDIL